MKITRSLLWFAISLLVLSVLGCESQPTPTAAAPEATHAYPAPMNDPEAVAASPTAMQDEDIAVPTEGVTDPEPTEQVALEPQVDNCVECHTDQQTLMDTADPIAEVVSENEGEG